MDMPTKSILEDSPSQRGKLYTWLAFVHIFMGWAFDQSKSSFKSFKGIEDFQKGRGESIAILVFWTFWVAGVVRLLDTFSGVRPHPIITLSIIMALGIWSWWFSAHIDGDVSRKAQNNLDRLPKYFKWSLVISFLIAIPFVLYLSGLMLRPH